MRNTKLDMICLYKYIYKYTSEAKKFKRFSQYERKGERRKFMTIA